MMWKRHPRLNFPFNANLSLRTLMTVSFGALFVGALILMNLERTLGIPFTSHSGAYGWARAQAQNRLGWLADQQTELVVHCIGERKKHAAVLSQTVLVPRALAEIDKLLQSAPNEDQLRAILLGRLKDNNAYRDLTLHLKLIKKTHEAYNHLLLVDSETGLAVAAADEADVGANLSSNPVFKEAKNASAQPIVVVGHLFSDHKPDVIVAAVGHGRSGGSEAGRSAVLLLSADAGACLKSALQTGSRSGAAEEIVVLDSDKRPLWASEGQAPLGDLGPKGGQAIPGKEMSAEDASTSEHVTGPSLAVYRNIEIGPGKTWTLIVRGDEDAFLAPMWRRTIRSTLICLAAILAGGLLAAIIANRIAKPINELSNTATEVEAGNLAARAKVEGSTEVAALAATFNSMVDRIERWNKELEDQINSRTAVLSQLNKNLVLEVEAHEQTEKALKESQSSLLTAQKIAHLGSWDWNIVTNELRWSEEIYRIFGIPRDQFGATYESFLNCVHPDDREFVKKSVENALERKSSYSIDHRIIRFGDEERLVHEQAHVTFDEAGAPIRMVGIVHDITERKQFEDQLKESEAFNKAVLNSLAANICVINAKGDVIAVNESWQEFARANGGESAVSKTGVGTNYLEVCRSAGGESAEQASEALRGIEEVIGGARNLFTMEYPCHSPTENRWFLMMISPLPSDQGGVAISHWDITKRKLAEEKFLLLSAMVEQSSEGMALRDLSGQLVFVNKALALMHEYSEEELVGKHFSILHTPDQLAATTQACEQLKTTGVFKGEIWHARRDGTAFPTLMHCSNLLDKNGNTKAIIAAMHDVSELKKAELALRSSNALLQALGDAQMRFISSMNEQDVFEGLLKSLLVLTESEYGFIGEILTDNNDGPYLKTLAFTPLNWDENNLALYRKYVNKGFGIHNLKNLIGMVITSAQPVIANDTQNDPRAGGLPPGHPAINSFMGLPYKVGGKLTGMIGVANRPGGYSEEMVDFLQPYLVTCSQILEAWRRDNLRKEAEVALKKNEALLLSVLDALPIGVFLTDERGQLVMVNPAGKRIWKGASLVGPEGYGGYKAWRRATGEKIQPHEWPAINAIKKGRTFLNEEMEIECFDGSRKTILNSAVPIRGEGGAITGAIIVNQDITDRVEGEKALIASEERMRMVIDSAPIGVRFSQNGKYAYVNKAFVEMFGCEDAENIVGLPVESLYPPEDRERIRRQEKMSVSIPEEPLFYERRGLRGGKEVFFVNVWLKAIDFRGRPSVLGFMIDVTEEKRLRSQLMHAQKMEALGTLAGGIAHDFNNILFAIIGYTELALEAVPTKTQVSEDLSRVLRATERAKEMVKQILTFSRQDRTQMKPLNIGPVIKEELKFLRASIPATIEIRCVIDPGLGMILGDPTQVHQVLMNLCTNAVHAMHNRAGLLTVNLTNTEALSESAEGLERLAPGKYVRIAVTDTGDGIPAEIIDRIFDPYFTTKGPGEGTGLGLSVVHGIVKNHGGVIRVSSEAGKGATFNVYLPTIEGYSDTERTEADLLEVPTGNENILFVDDEQPLADLGKEMLERLGYNVTATTSSLDAVEILRFEPHKFDLVITDFTMPNLTGLELAKELRSIRPDIPIICCTGFSRPLSQEEATKAGIGALIMKPVLRRDIAMAVRTLLDLEPSPPDEE